MVTHPIDMCTERVDILREYREQYDADIMIGACIALQENRYAKCCAIFIYKIHMYIIDKTFQVGERFIINNVNERETNRQT